MDTIKTKSKKREINHINKNLRSNLSFNMIYLIISYPNLIIIYNHIRNYLIYIR